MYLFYFHNKCYCFSSKTDPINVAQVCFLKLVFVNKVEYDEPEYFVRSSKSTEKLLMLEYTKEINQECSIREVRAEQS